MDDMKQTEDLRVGIIGGGPAGAICARILSRHVGSVTVFDKGRGPGGRLSTRRIGSAQFDHGAQYMTFRYPALVPFVRQWIEAGVIAPWIGTELDFREPDPVPQPPRSERLVGVPGMNSLVRHILQGLDVRFDARVTGLHRRGSQVEVSLESMKAELFDLVVVAIPGPQAEALLEAWPHLREPVSKVEYHPCWATMVEMRETAGIPWTAARTPDARVRWMARNSTKPGREAGESWVLHAAPDWTREHLNDSNEQIGRWMLAGLREMAGITGAPDMIRSHRWLYALVRQPVGRNCLLEDGVGVCGDALLGGRVENALASGLAMAERILSGGEPGFEPPVL